MPIPEPIELQTNTYFVYKSGIPFYDAAQLIGVAHLFFGTASAQVIDKGAYWKVIGVLVARDEQQVISALERLNLTGKERNLFAKKDQFDWKSFYEFFQQSDITKRKGRQVDLKAEYDVAVQIGTRGYDPLSKYEVLATRSTGETKKKFKDQVQAVAAATLGRSFAATVVSRSRRSIEEMSILPMFDDRFVLSGFMTYDKYFSHAAGGIVAAVFAAVSILLDLTSKRLPVVDFAYTREVKGPTRQPIFSSSGYLGFQRLCNLWQTGVQAGDKGVIDLLQNIRTFLRQTSRQNTHEQVQSLARWLADFVANPNVHSLSMIERLKARIVAASQNQSFQGAFVANVLLNNRTLIKEVAKMIQLNLPEVPWQVSEALAKALGFDEKGWMNQFTRLENAQNFTQLVQQVEHVISRGIYAEQKDNKRNIQEALQKARSLADQLRSIEAAFHQDEKSYRAWRSIFLLEVLSRSRTRTEESVETSA